MVPARTTCHIIGNSHYMVHRVTAALRTVVDLLHTLRRLYAAVVSRRCGVIGANNVDGWRAFIFMFILFPDDMFTIVYSHATSSW